MLFVFHSALFQLAHVERCRRSPCSPIRFVFACGMVGSAFSQNMSAAVFVVGQRGLTETAHGHASHIARAQVGLGRSHASSVERGSQDRDGHSSLAAVDELTVVKV